MSLHFSYNCESIFKEKQNTVPVESILNQHLATNIPIHKIIPDI
jgi:hypothetical protein